MPPNRGHLWKREGAALELYPKAYLLWAVSIHLNLSFPVCKMGGPALLWLI